MCISFGPHSSFCAAVPGVERGPLDLEALAEGADMVFTTLASRRAAPLGLHSQLAHCTFWVLSAVPFTPLVLPGPQSSLNPSLVANNAGKSDVFFFF